MPRPSTIRGNVVSSHSLLPVVTAPRRLTPEEIAESVFKWERLIHKAANYWYRKHSKLVEYDDLYQEGVTGWVHAGSIFDPTRGVQFSTYAKYWSDLYIRDSIRRALCHGYTRIDPLRVEKVPGTNQKRYPHPVPSPPLSLSFIQSDYDIGNIENELLSPLELKKPEIPPTEMWKQARKILTAKEWKVITLIFHKEASLQEVGNEFGVTRVRAGQIKEEALNKLRRSPEFCRLLEEVQMEEGY